MPYALCPMRLIIKLFAKLFALHAKRFRKALANPQEAQAIVRAEIFNRLTQSEYGKQLGVKSIDDWHRIPIVDYDDIERWIIPEFFPTSRESPLTPEPILFYEKTSGSRGAAKSIPYTKSLRRSFNHLFCVWAHDLILHGPPFRTGKLYFCISPQLGKSETKELAMGLADDSEYLDGWLRSLLSPFVVSPPGLNRLQDPEEFKEKLSLALLLEEKLEIISIWSPSFLKVHLDYIQRHRTRLREKLGKRISSDRSRLLLEEEIPWSQLWPELKLISCWDSARSADKAQFLRSLFPETLVQGKGLLATEAPMTVPLIEAQGFLPVLDEVFFEFEDDEGKIYLLQQIETGRVYSLIISQKGGLYRYRIGDRVRVSHFYGKTPCLEFLGRGGKTSDLVGEKLYEDFVREVLDDLGLEKTFFKSLVPATIPSEHYILLLDEAEDSVEEIGSRLDAALMRSPHYRQARLLGQLAPARVLVSPKIPEIVTLYKMVSGSKWGDIKHDLLATIPIAPELLLSIEI